MNKMAYKKREAADLMSIGATKLDGEIAAGRVKAVRSGKIILITRDEIERYLASLPAVVLKAHSNSPADKRRRTAARLGEAGAVAAE